VGDLLHSRRDQDESEIALRHEKRFVRKLFALDRETAEAAAITEEAGVGGSYRAEASGSGVLDQVVFRQLPPVKLSDEDVEIEVTAAALNFKDVVNALGLLPENAVSGGLAGHRLGVEVAGRVLRTGAKVLHLRTGDEVIARVADGFSGRVTAPSHCVVLRPKRLTPQQAAAVPVIYLTAWYSLCYLARMAPGETVLIHSASGGVGDAAIQLAKRAGAKVIATAGTKEKRDYVRNLGVEHVFDSRSLDFYNDVTEVTGGRGVDIVLNSLTGRFITQSLKCLAPFGRFVELGKFDIYRNNKLGLQRLGENISYFVVDIDRLAVQKPELHQQVLTEVATLFERGELQPPVITEFPISKLTEALRFMSRAAHRGKIVMNMEHDRVRALPPKTTTFRSDRTYLISGGASGFGLEIASWMANRGAQHLVLLSRSGCKSERDQVAVEAMRELGVEVLLEKADICDANAVRHLIQRIGNELPALAGVIHGAALLDDASIPTMDMQRFQRVFNPKAQGAWNLHEATLAAEADLDFFVMISSISSVMGLVGQVNYVAANFFQDSLAEYRRQQGLPATSVNLGVLGQYAGMSNSEEDVQKIVGLLETHGILVMPLSDVLPKLEAALIQKPVQRMTARIDWARFRSAYPHLTRDSRFVDLMSDAALARGARPKGSNLLATLAGLEPAQQRELLEKELTTKLGLILDASPDKIDVSVSIDKLGLDWLMLTDLQIWISRLLDITLPLIKLLKGPSVTTLAADLLTQLDNHGTDDVGAKQAGEGSASFTLADLEGVQILNPWLIRGLGNPNAPVRLICFHSMGVGASLFTRFLLNPLDDYDILAVQTPGREERIAEPVAESVTELVDQIVPNLRPLFDRPVVIWGHSFGGIVAWEVIRQLRELHGCVPVHFIVTGTEAPHEAPKWQKREIMLKAMVPENSAEYLLSQSRYVDAPEFFKMILPGMRRDMPLLQTYSFQESAPLDCPMTAFAARQDDMVYTDRIREWSAYTLAGFELIEVDGDHWFLDRNRELITATMHEIARNVIVQSTKSADFARAAVAVGNRS
jgi:NADPH:quinone reductase-like Zn-dependent oxidoreductase/surfactin synthase thioesterase subunit